MNKRMKRAAAARSSRFAARRTSGRRLRVEQLEDRRLLTVLYRVDAGGAQLAGTPVWSADTAAAPSSFSNASTGGNSGTNTTTATINMSDPSIPAGTPMALFQTERFDKAGSPNLLWDFPVTPGNYQVRLYFAETYSGAFAVGARVFDVAIEGQTVLSRYDVFADVGSLKGVVKSFIITSDADLNIDFLREVQNPTIKGIEILTAPAAASPLVPSASTFDFGNVFLGQTGTQQVTLTNGGQTGDPNITIDPSAASLAPSGTPFTFSFTQTTPIVLAPGQSTVVSLNFIPSTVTSTSADLSIPNSGVTSPVKIHLMGAGVVQPPTVIYRVNAGGPQLAGTPVWSADTAAAPSSFSNASTGGNSGTNTTTATINMSDPSIPAGTPMALFQTERFDKAGIPNLLWDFPVSPGQYLVRLYFAETASSLFSVGARVFDVAIEGQTVLSRYDIFADVGSLKGVVKSFLVTSDADLNISFLREVQNPDVKGIEILKAPPALEASATSLNFGNVNVGQAATQQVTLTNGGQTGDPNIAIDPSAASLAPSGTPFTLSFTQTTPIALAPGQSTVVTVNYTPTAGTSDSATLQIPNSGPNSPLSIALTGTGATQTSINFGKSTLSGTTGLAQPSSLQFGPDGRLYVAQQNGLIRAYTIVRNSANSYTVSATENITLVQQIPNHDDDGTLDTNVTTRLVTGLLVTGTAQNPVLYVSSSDPRIGGGSSGTDTNLDTNSGIISRLTWNGTAWVKLDLVRGLPRSEENHASNGLQLDPTTNTLYLAVGGNTNMGAPSNNFAFLPDYALSAAILSINLNAIGNTTYDIPTLDDENRPGVNDANDPFGGDNGKNQAMLVPGGPVQVYAPGFRNPYDLVITTSGRMYAVDNGPNAGWGDVPILDANGNATNQVNEPGVTYEDSLHFVTGPGYYAGHPNPTRAYTGNTFNTTNPQSPVTVGDPIESTFLVPGPQNHALALFGSSTDGITEYTASTFGGAMQGDLLIASFDNTIKRITLSADGTQVVSDTNLFSNVGLKPLDVTSPGAGPFGGSIWVVDIATGTIIVFEPAAAGGGNPNDFDGDGYTNADEIANGTDPNNAADVPPDWDHDFVSNLLDPNDDNDALPDTSDPYAIDPANGATTPVGTLYDWKNTTGQIQGGIYGSIFGMGFTGLMTNGVDNYEALYDPNAVTAGGAASVFTIDSATAGTALGSTNTQHQAFQFGVNVANETTPFTAETTVLGAFNGLTPQAGQQMGFYIGTGDQDNFVQLVLTGDNGGSIQALREVGGVDTIFASQAIALPGPGSVNLWLTVDPFAKTVQPRYSVDGVNFVNLGSAISIPASWLSGSLAVGLISTNPAGTGLPVTWGELGIVHDQSSGSAAGRLEIFTFGSIDNSSTAHTDSFRIYNNSTGGIRIDSISIDLTTSLLPDLVYTPFPGAGDSQSIDFTPDSGGATTGLIDHVFSGAHSGGFDGLTVDFGTFDPGEVFTFHVDVDPLSITGAAAPGPAGSASISGLELAGATVTIHFGDGSTVTGQPFALPQGASFYKVHSQNNFSTAPIDPAPQISLVGVPSTPATLQSTSQTVQITGPVGASVRLLQSEVALELAGVPNGGVDVHPYDGNKVVSVTEQTGVIGAGGFVDIPITLRSTLPEGGLNYLAAVIDEPDGRTSNLSNEIRLALNALPPGSVPGSQPLSIATASVASTSIPGDYDHNDVVDARDFAVWQQTYGETGLGLDADGNANGIIDIGDYVVWRASMSQPQGNQAPAALAATAPLAAAIRSSEKTTVDESGLADSVLSPASVNSSMSAGLSKPPRHADAASLSADERLRAIDLLLVEQRLSRATSSAPPSSHRRETEDQGNAAYQSVQDATAWHAAFEAF
jgi:glucose/arabinose dehydrogenase